MAGTRRETGETPVVGEIGVTSAKKEITETTERAETEEIDGVEKEKRSLGTERGLTVEKGTTGTRGAERDLRTIGTWTDIGRQDIRMMTESKRFIASVMI